MKRHERSLSKDSSRFLLTFPAIQSTLSPMSLDSSIKALKDPGPLTGFDKLRFNIRMWWDDHIWYKWVPQWFRTFCYRAGRVWYSQVSTRIWPRQRWLTKQISCQWNDKVTLIPDVLYAMIIHFVGKDGEDALNTVHWEDSDAAMLRDIDHWARVGRKQMEQQLSEAYPPIPEDFGEWLAHGESTQQEKDCYEEVRRIEAIMEEKDTRYLTWIVVNRAKLWT